MTDMEARSYLRPAMFVGGTALCLVSVAGMAAGWGESRTPQPPVNSSDSPTAHGPAPADPTAFLGQLGRATHTGDVAFLASHLNPAVIDRYGRRQCTVRLRSLTPVSFEVARVHRAAPYTWETDGLSTVVPHTLAVDVAYTSDGRTADGVVHITEVGGAFTWYTDCGTPLG